jgi:hypothetical protein
LISVQALAAIWTSQELAHSVGTLLEVLVRMLRLNFAYARIDASIEGSPIDAVRFAPRRDTSPAQLRDALNGLLEAELPAALVVPNPLGAGTVWIAPLRFAFEERAGALICLDPQSTGWVFDAFYTTKPQGMGMGSRSAAPSRGTQRAAVGRS